MIILLLPVAYPSTSRSDTKKFQTDATALSIHEQQETTKEWAVYDEDGRVGAELTIVGNETCCFFSRCFCIEREWRRGSRRSDIVIGHAHDDQIPHLSRGRSTITRKIQQLTLVFTSCPIQQQQPDDCDNGRRISSCSRK